MFARSAGFCVIAFCCLQLTGCGGGPGTFDPVQHDLDVISSDADLETRRKASRNLVGQSFSDEQIAKMMAIVKDENQDDTIRARVAYAMGSIGPERGNHLMRELLDVAERPSSSKGLRNAINVATDRLSWKN